MLRVAAAVGDRGGHVLGRAIARHARGLELEVPEAQDYEAVPGLGATARSTSSTYHVGSHRFIDEAGLCEDALSCLVERGGGGVTGLRWR